MATPNIPNTNQRTVRARMKVESFVSPEKPTLKQIQEFDKKVNDFLNTIDNTKRFLNGRNSYSIGNKIYIIVWYLEKVASQPVTTPFGAKVKQGQPIVKDVKQNNNTQEKTA